jgi:surfactin synthase thioesterase subunit
MAEAELQVCILEGGFDEWYATGSARCSCEAGACSKIEEAGPAVPETGPPVPLAIDPSKWLTCVQRRENASYRLVYFGWAGNRCGRGSDATPRSQKRSWSLPDADTYEVVLPGRGSRLGEPCPTSVFTLAHDLARAIAAFFDTPKPFCFLGFAFGAIIAYETAMEMERIAVVRGQQNERTRPDCRGMPIRTPFLLCAISSEGPGWPGRHTKYHELSDADFIRELRSKGGTEELLAEPDLLPLFLPTVKADVALEETYSPDAGRRSSLLMLVLYGTRHGPKEGDTLITREQADYWMQTSKNPISRVVSLDAFDWFLLEDDEGVTAVLSELRGFISDCFPGM